MNIPGIVLKLKLPDGWIQVWPKDGPCCPFCRRCVGLYDPAVQSPAGVTYHLGCAQKLIQKKREAAHERKV